MSTDPTAGASDPDDQREDDAVTDTLTDTEYVAAQRAAREAARGPVSAPQRVDVTDLLRRLPEAARTAYATANTPEGRAAVAAERAAGIAEATADARARQDAARDAAWRRCKPMSLAAAGDTPLHPQQDRTHVRDGKAWTPHPGSDGAVSTWLDGDRTNLLLVGSSRRGKSWAAWHVGEHARRRGQWAVGHSAPTLIDLAKPSAVDQGAGWHAAIECDLLIVDDLGRDRATDWSLEKWYLLFETRLTAHRRTIVTTNEAYDDLVGRYGDPIVQRIVEDARVVRVEGANLGALTEKPW